MSKSGLRVEWIDLLRVIAIFAVVLVHATESIYGFNVEFMETISMQSKVFAITAGCRTARRTYFFDDNGVFVAGS